MIAEKRNILTSEAIYFIRTRISFSLLRLIFIICLHGSRTNKIVDSEHHETDIYGFN